jgi:hypothetical protein
METAPAGTGYMDLLSAASEGPLRPTEVDLGVMLALRLVRAVQPLGAVGFIIIDDAGDVKCYFQVSPRTSLLMAISVTPNSLATLALPAFRPYALGVHAARPRGRRYLTAPPYRPNHGRR